MSCVGLYRAESHVQVGKMCCSAECPHDRHVGNRRVSQTMLLVRGFHIYVLPIQQRLYRGTSDVLLTYESFLYFPP